LRDLTVGCTVKERRLFPGELSCPALDLQPTGDWCG